MRSLHYFVVFTLKFMYVHVPNAEPLIQLKIWKQTICLPSCECRCCTLGLQGTPLWIFGMGHVDGCNMSVVGVTNRVRKRFPVWLRSMPSFVAVPDSTCDELSCSRLDNSITKIMLVSRFVGISFDRILLCKYMHNSWEKQQKTWEQHIFCFLGVDIQVSKKEM